MKLRLLLILKASIRSPENFNELDSDPDPFKFYQA
jgi:hypothetical protein